MYSLLYPSAATTLYGLVGWTIARMFQTIRMQVEEHHKMTIPLIEEKTLLMWKKTHRLTCDLVHHLNRCFSFILIINVTYVFISSISYTFYFLANFKQDANASLVDLTAAAIALSKGFTQMWIIAFLPSAIRHEVILLKIIFTIHGSYV